MTTLRERLDEMRTRIDDLSQAGWHDAAREVAVYADEFESWAYGQERDCATCADEGRATDCRTCHGTGTIREPGLVERVEAGAMALRLERDKPAALVVVTAEDVLAALRTELGVNP